MNIYIRLEGYLKEWLVYKMGNPVRFPPHSNENAIIARHISRHPIGASPQLKADGDITIIAPSAPGKPATEWNYFGRRGRSELISAIEILFRCDMWNGLAPLMCSTSLNNAIDEWCAASGISLDNREAVRQKFYRIRKSYESYGIILGKKYKKIHHNRGKK